jgi:hypothetical protein
MPPNRSGPGLLADVETAISTVSRPGSLELLWNWRYELLIMAGLAGPFTVVGLTLGIGWLGTMIAAEAALLTIAVAWSPTRRWLISLAWCVITPHRIRTGCKHSWVQSRDGRLPVVLHTKPTDLGECALLWCRAGIVPDDLEAARNIITAACWARDVRVIGSERGRHMVTLEVVRNQSPRQQESPEQSWPYLPQQQEDPEEPATAA